MRIAGLAREFPPKPPRSITPRSAIGRETLMNYRNVALLLDSAPPTWTSQEDRHFRLCLHISRPDYRPVERSSG